MIQRDAIRDDHNFQSQFSSGEHSEEEEEQNNQIELDTSIKQKIFEAQQSAEMQQLRLMNELLNEGNQQEDPQIAQVEVLSIPDEGYSSAQKPMKMVIQQKQYHYELHHQSIVSNRQIKAELPRLEGWLFKRSPVFLVGWQKRYCCLEDGKFYYFMDEAKMKYLGCLDFNLVPIELDIIEQSQVFKLKPKGVKKIFIFGNFQVNVDEWIRCIRLYILESQGHIKPVFDICSQKRFWRCDRLSQREFERTADTGDIILFKGKTLGCSFLRKLTGSEYDHVGLILRYSSGDLYLFESTGVILSIYIIIKGVGLLKWDIFIKKNWHKLYEKLVFRHLEVDRTDGLVRDFDKFIKAGLFLYKDPYAIGKKYKVSAAKLLNKKESEKNLDKRTFFCSELVAASYKRLNLLPQQISAAKYWPGDFAAQKNLKLQNAKLGREVLIDFVIPY